MVRAIYFLISWLVGELFRKPKKGLKEQKLIGFDKSWLILFAFDVCFHLWRDKHEVLVGATDNTLGVSRWYVMDSVWTLMQFLGRVRRVYMCVWGAFRARCSQASKRLSKRLASDLHTEDCWRCLIIWAQIESLWMDESLLLIDMNIGYPFPAWYSSIPSKTTVSEPLHGGSNAFCCQLRCQSYNIECQADSDDSVQSTPPIRMEFLWKKMAIQWVS